MAWTPSLPPWRDTEDGSPRRVGVELELIGLGVPEVSALVAEAIGGEVDPRTRYEHFIGGDPAGDWGVELDNARLKEMGRRPPDEDDLLALLDDAAESVLRAGAEVLVPVEVVSPPLPIPRLADVERLITRLRDAGARGTGAGVAYAFGLQLNPEMPALDAETITRYLKAYLCLHDVLVELSAVDATRTLTGYTAPFSTSYARKVIDADYWPDRGTLIDDYLADNATRNRALDMLPLFLHVEPERVRAVVDDPRVKPRPTLHYRLPNCEIDRPGWGVHDAWEGWLQVERLAADRSRLEAVCAEYATVLDRTFGQILDHWAAEVRRWLEPSDDR